MLAKVGAAARLGAWWLHFGVMIVSYGCSSSSSSGNNQAPTTAFSGKTLTSSSGGADAAANPTAQAAVVDPASSQHLPTVANLVNAQFKLTASAVGISVCSGTVNLEVNSTFTTASTTQLLQIPSASVNCGWLGTINLAEILGAFSQPLPPSTNPMVVANGVIAMNALGNATYNPPRPLLPAFLSATAGQLGSLNFTQSNIAISTANGSDTGAVNIKMNSYDQTFTAPTINQAFSHVMDFTVTNTGFNKIDQVANFMFSSMEYKINSSPVAIVSIHINTPAKALAESVGATPQAGTGIIGSVSQSVAQSPNGFVAGISGLVNLQIDLDLISQDGLTAELANTDQNSAANIGEQISGSSTAGD